jgi:hypothetical protein
METPKAIVSSRIIGKCAFSPSRTHAEMCNHATSSSGEPMLMTRVLPEILKILGKASRIQVARARALAMHD